MASNAPTPRLRDHHPARFARLLGWLLLGACLYACGQGDAPDTAGRDCAAGLPPVLTDSGVGALRVNVPMTQLRAACDILHDTTLQRGREGMTERRVTVILGSVATTSTVADDRVWRIEITSPRFQTRDSLGVGTTVGALRRRKATFVAGEVASYALVEGHCGLSFQLPDGPEEPASIPDSARVTTVLVTGC